MRAFNVAKHDPLIDLHCHFLPFVDDGAKSVAEALLLARAAVSNGVSDAVLTPHINPGRWDNRLSTLKTRFEAFQSVLRIRDIPLRVHLGAEVRLGPDVLRLDSAGWHYAPSGLEGLGE